MKTIKISKENLNDYEAEIQDYSKAIELEPENALIYAKRGFLRSLLNEAECALKDYNKATILDFDKRHKGILEWY